MAPTITVTPAATRVTVHAGGQLIADSTAALELREGSAPPVLYIPRKDARMEHFAPSSRKSTCPWKGQASYFTLRTADGELPDAVWSYEMPKPGVEAIAGHLAFYPDRVTIRRD